VLAQLVIDRAKKLNKLPVPLLLIDLEAQYSDTIAHAEEIMLLPEVEPYWICLPLALRNAVSCFEPKWQCWDPDAKGKWVRDMPKLCISDEKYFDWFFRNMEFEEFIIEFARWFSKGERTACFIGIRTDESLNRWRTIFAMQTKKITFRDNQWTTLVKATKEPVYNCYPIYDWKVSDIWKCVYDQQFAYNRIYDKMYLAGRSVHDQRICQPYGDDQRKGLDLFHLCEPETWFKVVNRVAGANFGALYKGQRILGNQKVHLPPGHTKHYQGVY
ncbi:hypothetical protein LCGC14_2401060, partial [marine sediment metagenome]